MASNYNSLTDLKYLLKKLSYKKREKKAMKHCTLSLIALFRRRRPAYNVDDMPLTTGVDKFSFPSGHATRAVLLTVFFTVLYPLFFILYIPLGRGVQRTTVKGRKNETDKVVVQIIWDILFFSFRQ